MLKTPSKKKIRIKELSKLAGYKISTKKSVAFLYTNNNISEKDICLNPINSIQNIKIIKYNFLYWFVWMLYNNIKNNNNI